MLHFTLILLSGFGYGSDHADADAGNSEAVNMTVAFLFWIVGEFIVTSLRPRNPFR